MIFTGFALYSEGRRAGQLERHAVRLGHPGCSAGSMQVHNLHRLGMWILMTFVLVHVYARSARTS
jgi:Ni/Fe-hydrogenase 1 B-type cytochrome subunit